VPGPLPAGVVERGLNYRLMHENLLVVLDFLRTLSLYQLIKQQVESGNLELLSVELMNSAYKNIFDGLSSERVRLLKQVAPGGVFGQSSIRNIPIDLQDSSERLDALGEELGIEFPKEYYDKLKSLPQAQVAVELNNIRSIYHPQSTSQMKNEASLFKNVEDAKETLDKNLKELDKKIIVSNQLKADIERLEDDRPLEEIKLDLEDEPPLPVEPVRPLAENFQVDGEIDVDAFHEAQMRYMLDYFDYVEKKDAYDEIRQRNISARERYKTEADREEGIADKTRDLRKLDGEIRTLAATVVQNRISLETAVANTKKSTIKTKNHNQILSILDLIAGKEQPLNRKNLEKLGEGRMKGSGIFDLLKGAVVTLGIPAVAGILLAQNSGNSAKSSGLFGHGKGTDLDTRGMASLRKNYGYSDGESESDSDEEVEVVRRMNYDDRRNDSYYMKPKR